MSDPFSSINVIPKLCCPICLRLFEVVAWNHKMCSLDCYQTSRADVYVDSTLRSLINYGYADGHFENVGVCVDIDDVIYSISQGNMIWSRSY